MLIGTDNRRPRDPAKTEESGVLMAFDAKDGRFLGQVTHRALPDRTSDLNKSVLCRPAVSGDRAYYTTNGGELVCLSTAGSKLRVVWSLDMVRDLGVFKRDANDAGNPLPSPLVLGDLVFCLTGNGNSRWRPVPGMPGVAGVPRPKAPSFLAVHKDTGRVVWSSDAPGTGIEYGQWASPAACRVGGVDQVLFPGGDGLLYGFEAWTGKLLWRVDCNPTTAVRWAKDRVGTRTSFLATPAVRDGLAIIGASIDLEQRIVPRPVYAVDVARKAIRWTFLDEDGGGTFGSVALGKECAYVLWDSGELICLDVKTGQELWRDTAGGSASRFSSPIVHESKVIVASARQVSVYRDGRERLLLGRVREKAAAEASGTPLVVGDRLYVPMSSHLSCYRIR
ncbi:MAG: PQQ-binding-like beta-propeller repeat protein [Gemmataceae bacterium]